MARTAGKRLKASKQVRPCALCYGALSDGEQHIHDKHRDTELGQQYLAQLDKPKLAPPRVSPAQKKPKRVREVSLSLAEKEVVELLIEGYTTKEISTLMQCGRAAVGNRIAQAKRKLNASTMYQLVAIYKDKYHYQERNEHGGYRGEGEEGDNEDRTSDASESSEAA